MLVLTRKIGEGVWIGDGVRVSVLETRGHSVRIGIEADPAIQVQRDEIRGHHGPGVTRGPRIVGTSVPVRVTRPAPVYRRAALPV